jgi:hypothetical protein
VAHYYGRAGSCSFFNPIGPLTPDQEKAFKEAIVLFLGVVLSILGDNLVDAHPRWKKMWDALEAKFGVADAGGKRYAMEKFKNYKMGEIQYVVE